MRKQVLIFLLLPFFFAVSYGQNYTWNWATGFGSADQDWIKALKVDNEGNSYVLGEFEGDFIEFGAARLNNYQQTLENVGVFLAKFDANGELIWKKNLNSQSNLKFDFLEIDFKGNCYLTGTFIHEYAYLDQIKFLNSSGMDRSADAFLAKVSTTGDVEWVKLLGALGNDVITKLEVDGVGNAYLSFRGAIGRHDQERKKGLNFQLSTRVVNIYVIKYSPDGKRLWANELFTRRINLAEVYELGVDAMGSVYVLGRYADGDPLYVEDIKLRTINEAFPDLFLIKLDDQGEILWADNTGGPYMEVDEEGNVYIFGTHTCGNINDFLDIQLATIESSEGEAQYVIKYDMDGEYLWHRIFGSINSCGIPYKFRYGLDGNLYILGVFEGESIFGDYRIVKDGLHLIKMDSEGTISEPITWIKDDKSETTENPIQNFQGASVLLRDQSLRVNTQVFNLSEMEVDAEGCVLISGHQFDQELFLAGRKLNNLFAPSKTADIWLAKFKPTD